MLRSVLPPSLGEHAPIVASAASAIPVNNALRIHQLPIRLGDVSGTLRRHAPAKARPAAETSTTPPPSDRLLAAIARLPLKRPRCPPHPILFASRTDRKSTCLNSSH